MWIGLKHKDNAWKWKGRTEDTVKAWNDEYPTNKGGCAYIKLDKDNNVVGWQNKACDAPALALCESENVTGMYKIFTGMSYHSRNKNTYCLDKYYHTCSYIDSFPH